MSPGRDTGTPDYLVVGAGSAGCVLANRLSAAGAFVLLLEAGIDTPPGAVPDDINDLYPRSYFNGAYMWPGLTAEQSADGSSTATPFAQARVMGGGSSVMGMAAVRGVPSDYDGWERAGATGWGWPAVLPYFRRLETDWDFDGDLHGSTGPVVIRRHRLDDWPPFATGIGTAAGSMGWPVIDDMNGDFADGCGRLPMSSRLSGRVSAAAAYLDHATRERPNLSIVPEVTVERLLFEGSRCVGVSAVAGGAACSYRAGHVIVSAGAVHSPALLQRSGIGPEPDLRRLGVPVVAARTGVGRNLQNHPVAYLATHTKPEARPSPVLRAQFSAALRYSSGSDPDLCSDMFMLIVNKSSWHGLGETVAGLGVSLLRPFSRGDVTTVSTTPGVGPRIRFGFLTDPRDRSRMIDGLGLAVELMSHEAVRRGRHELFAAGYGRAVRGLNRPGIRNALLAKLLAALLDGPAPVRRSMLKYGVAGGSLDERRMREQGWLASTVGRRSFGTYHPTGTCRIGEPDDEAAVVDRRCSVIGTESLSVVDASVMPTIPRGNTNIPVIMTAERAADLLLSP